MNHGRLCLLTLLLSTRTIWILTHSDYIFVFCHQLLETKRASALATSENMCTCKTSRLENLCWYQKLQWSCWSRWCLRSMLSKSALSVHSDASKRIGEIWSKVGCLICSFSTSTRNTDAVSFEAVADTFVGNSEHRVSLFVRRAWLLRFCVFLL